MSRVGKHIIPISDGVTVKFENGVLNITKGTIKEQYKIPSCLNTEISEAGIKFIPVNNDRNTKAMWGTSQRNVSNLISGLNKDFTTMLKLSGVGYKVAVKGKQVVLQLGFSHDVNYDIPEGISISCPDPTTIVISGRSKNLVGDVAADLRRYRKPEPYKGKGIIRQGEFVYRKEGKKK